MITVKCRCGRTLAVDDSYAGKTGRCHYCGVHVPIPAPGAARREDVRAGAAPPADRAPEDRPDRATTAGAISPRAGLITCGVFLLATLAVPRPVGDETKHFAWQGLSSGRGDLAVLLVGSWAIGVGAVAAGAALPVAALPAARLALGGAGLAVVAWSRGAFDLGAVGAGLPGGSAGYLLAGYAAVLATAIATGVRLRVGGGPAARIVLGLAGAALAALAGQVAVPGIAAIAGHLGNWESIAGFFGHLSGIDEAAMLLFWTAMLICGAFAALGGLSGSANASVAGVTAVRVAVFGGAVYVLGRLVYQPGPWQAVGALALLIPLVALSALFCMGVSGFVSALAARLGATSPPRAT